MENIIRYNVFDRNIGGMLVFRNGDKNIAYGNMFIRGSGGIRFKEANDILCFNNYFDGSISTSKDFSMAFDYLDPNLKNINIIYNTFINSTIDLGELVNFPKKNTKINFFNNIFNKKLTNLFLDPTSKSKLMISEALNFFGNIFYKNDSNFDNFIFTKENNNTIKDLNLIRKKEGFYGLSKTSGSSDSSYKDYPDLLEFAGIDNYYKLDMDINEISRPSDKAKKKIGCEEYLENVSDIRFKNLNIPRGPKYLENVLIDDGLIESIKTNDTPIPILKLDDPRCSTINFFVFIL